MSVSSVAFCIADLDGFPLSHHTHILMELSPPLPRAKVRVSCRTARPVAFATVIPIGQSQDFTIILFYRVSVYKRRGVSVYVPSEALQLPQPTLFPSLPDNKLLHNNPSYHLSQFVINFSSLRSIFSNTNLTTSSQTDWN